MKNSADLGGCYPPRPSASVDNTLLDLQNSSYPTQPHSIIANSLFARLQYLLFLPQQLQPNVNSLAARPQLTDWWGHMCRNVTKTVVSSLNSAGDQQGIAGVWTSTARKYPAQKSEGNRTAVRKVTR